MMRGSTPTRIEKHLLIACTNHVKVFSYGIKMIDLNKLIVNVIGNNRSNIRIIQPITLLCNLLTIR